MSAPLNFSWIISRAVAIQEQGKRADLCPEVIAALVIADALVIQIETIQDHFGRVERELESLGADIRASSR